MNYWHNDERVAEALEAIKKEVGSKNARLCDQILYLGKRGMLQEEMLVLLT